jgi:cytochrome c oxidase subunit II
VAEPRDRFQAWLAQQAQPAVSTGSPGEQAFLRNTCGSYHAIRGTWANAHVGPDLPYLGSRSPLAGGVLQNMRDHPRRWLGNAQAVEPGVLMPALANLSAADRAALADDREGLR